MMRRLLLVGEVDAGTRDYLEGLREGTSNLVCQPITWSKAYAGQITAAEGDLLLVSATVTGTEAAQWLRTSATRTIEIPIVVMLGEASDAKLICLAAEFADDFIIAPPHGGELSHRIARLMVRDQPRASADALDHASAETKRRLTQQIALSGLVGRDPAFLKTVAKIPLAARCGKGPVLLVGETGTGKELCARVIHNVGQRSNFPFIPVDCATLPDHLFENELFGHVSGAFTDAKRDQKGLVELSEGGTLFLDEVDSLSAAAQSKLLRLIQERTYRPLGSSRLKPIDVNIIAATNSDLDALVRARQFRADLYFRLNVLRLDLVPLRERRGDISLLAQHILATICDEERIPRKVLTPATLRKLTEHDWPGNVRELHNIIRRAVYFSDGLLILPADITGLTTLGCDKAPTTNFRQARMRAIERFERQYVEDLMRQANGNVTRAARLAEKDRRAFGRLVKRYEVSRNYQLPAPASSEGFADSLRSP